jgi:glycosyltransferase involved in cell wall biosynthesis
VPELKAVIAGPGDQRPYTTLAENLGVKNNIVLIGPLYGKVKIGAIDAALAITLPSLRETFPLVIMEAWAREKPVITTPVGDIPYRVKHRENGILIPPRNPKALADAIILLFQDENLRKKLGASGKKQIYIWNEIVTKLIEIYNGI